AGAGGPSDRAALYVEDVVLQYHSRSRDAPPGAGAGESLRVPAERFAVLASHPDWRRKLSHFAEAPFELDGLHLRAGGPSVLAPRSSHGSRPRTGAASRSSRAASAREPWARPSRAPAGARACH